jgi:hypothetical protein
MSNRHLALEYSEQYTMNHTHEATKSHEATQRSNECHVNLLYLCYDRNL